MKMTYNKPELNEVKLAANQAIASCGVKRVGYDNSWTRGTNGQFGWKTPTQAWEAYDRHADFTYTESKNDNGPYVFPVYYGETIDANGNRTYGTFHDENRNGVMDAGEYIAWQEGGDYNTVGAILSAGTAVVNS